jgi:hypothetical protein
VRADVLFQTFHLTPGPRDAAAACGQFFDACQQGRLAHLGQEPLNDALAGANTRPLADAWAWDRKSDGSDISPLVACTLALWGHQRTRPRFAPYDILRSIA